MRRFWFTIGTVAGILFLGWAGTRVVLDIQFNQTIEGYLKRAADANTIELARRELNVAVVNAERRGLIEGYTSILWRTPDEDVGFWHQNLRVSLGELDHVQPGASQLERSNILIKLRETLLDHGKNKIHVTVPPGISVYPMNGLFVFWGWLTACIAVIGIVLGLIKSRIDW